MRPSTAMTTFSPSDFPTELKSASAASAVDGLSCRRVMTPIAEAIGIE
jgi:hypothetical protein